MYTSLVTKKLKRGKGEINSAGKTAHTAKCSPLGNKYNQLKGNKEGMGGNKIKKNK